MIDLLIERSSLPYYSNIIDVGCGIGGTTRYLAMNMGCKVTGITISGQQVKMARDLTARLSGVDESTLDSNAFMKFGEGNVRYLELDAEKIDDYFGQREEKGSFDCVWISEALSHLPGKVLFFQNALRLLKPSGKLVIADWFKAEGLTEAQLMTDIKPIEGWLTLGP